MTKRNRKGFTLMEMLIVVAIIAILIAVAIPTFSSALTKAKAATDEANLRALKGLIVTDYLANEASFTHNESYALNDDGSAYVTGTDGMPSKSGTGDIYYTCTVSGTTYTFEANTGIDGVDSSVASFTIAG